MLYAPPVLKVTAVAHGLLRREPHVNSCCTCPTGFTFQPNIMVFIAELFWWFENVRPDFVQPRDVQELKDGECFSTGAVYPEAWGMTLYI